MSLMLGRPRAISAHIIFALIVPAVAAEIDIYSNARYGYSVSYPRDLLRPLPEADNGDGRIFKAKTGAAEFRVFAEGNALDESAELIAKRAESDCPDRKASYRVVKPALVVVSCTMTNGHVYYQKTLIRGGMETTMTANYPKSEGQIWARAVSVMSKTMTAARPL